MKFRFKTERADFILDEKGEVQVEDFSTPIPRRLPLWRWLEITPSWEASEALAAALQVQEIQEPKLLQLFRGRRRDAGDRRVLAAAQVIRRPQAPR